MLKWALPLDVDGASPLAGLQKPAVPRFTRRAALVIAAVTAAAIAVAFVRAGDMRVVLAGAFPLGVVNGAAWLLNSRKVRRRLAVAPLLADEPVKVEAPGRSAGEFFAVVFMAVVFWGALAPGPAWPALLFSPSLLFAALAVAYDMKAVDQVEQDTGCAVVFDIHYRPARPYLVRAA